MGIMILLYHRWCTSVNRGRNILKISQSAKWQTRDIRLRVAVLRYSSRFRGFRPAAARNKAALGTSGRVRRGARGLGLTPAPCAAAPVVFAAIRAAMLRCRDTGFSPCDVSHRASDEPRRCMSLSSALAPSSLASPSIGRVFLRSLCARRCSIDSLNDFRKISPLHSGRFCDIMFTSCESGAMAQRGEIQCAESQFALQSGRRTKCRKFQWRRHLAEGTHNAFASLCVSPKAIPTASFETRREAFLYPQFVFGC